MDILTRYCLNDDDIGFEILSDQSNFTTGQVNYENENMNVGLPVFTIHGNHDDPSSVDNTSAVDILATANLVNYFGKANIQYGTDGDPHGEVKVSPILIRKGDTKLALYGLGNIRDERMCRLLNRPRGVQWARPTEYEEEWINVFVLHQNRVAHLQGAKNIVKESHLPRWLHMVIWGHEHECIVSPWRSHISGGAFSVLQPGSSVATALSEGESKKKHVFMLEMKGGKWRTVKIPLETVRPFLFDTVVLANQKAVNRGNPDTVMDFLTAKVEQMVERANLDRTDKSPNLPLIRLRVDYTGFSTVNPQLFAQQFVDRVANAQDILMWQKAAQKKDKSGRMLPEVMISAAETRLESLIQRNLPEELRLLSEVELSGALEEYVQKEERGAIVDTVGLALQETAKDAEQHIEELDNVDLSQKVLEEIQKAAKRRKDKMKAAKDVRETVTNARAQAAPPTGMEVDREDAAGGVGGARGALTSKNKASPTAGGAKRAAASTKGSSKAAPKVVKTTSTKKGASGKSKQAKEIDWGDDSDDSEEEAWNSDSSGAVDGGDPEEDSPGNHPGSNPPARAARSQHTRNTRNTRQRTLVAGQGSTLPARSAALASLRTAEPGAVSTRITRSSQSQGGAGVSKWGALKRN